MSALQEIVIPDIREVVYSTSNRLEALKKYLSLFDEYNNLEAKMLHNKLKNDYLRYISNPDLLNQTEMIITKCHEKVVELHPELSVKTKAREKAFMSSFHKYLIALKEGQSLETVRDTLAGRIIIDSQSLKAPEDLCKKLGEIVNEIILFLLDNDYQICFASQPKDTNKFKPEENPDVYIPKFNYISSEFRKFVKDYVNSPKDDGYQSFHLLAIAPNGGFLEIQFRTYDMDYYAEHMLASHDKYKEEKIKKYSLPTLDRSRVHWEKYRYNKFSINNTSNIFFVDEAGLEKSIEICSHNYDPSN